MSRSIEIKCDICNRKNNEIENLTFWGAIESGHVKSNLKYFNRQGGLDVCPDCMIKIMNFIKNGGVK